MRIHKLIATLTGLTASATAFAHGPHAEIHGAGIAETLIHLLAHAWPVVPIALVGILLYKRSVRN